MSSGTKNGHFEHLYSDLDTPAFAVDVLRDGGEEVQFDCRRVNEAFRRKAGVEDEKDIKGLLELCKEEDRPTVLNQFRRCVRDCQRIVFRIPLAGELLEGPCQVTLTPCVEEGRVEVLYGVLERPYDPGDREHSRNEFRQAVESSGHGVFMTDSEGTITYVNNELLEMSGYDRDELIGKSPQVLSSGVHDETFYNELWDTITAGDVWKGEIVNRRKSGELYYAQQTIVPVNNEFGETRSYIAIQEDVTEQKRQERRLEEKSKAIDQSPIGIVMTDATAEDNPICFMNDGFERMTGYSREKVLGRNCRFLQGEETDDEVVREIREAVDNEEPITVELRNYRADGEMFWNQLIITPIWDEGGDVNRFLGYQQDITQRKLFEQELKLFRETMQRSPDSIFIVDPETERFIDVNKTARDILGYSRDELLGMRVSDINPEFGKRMDWSTFREKLKETGPVTLETRHRRKSGQEIPVEVHANYIEIEDHARILALARDITEWKEARQKISDQARFFQKVSNQVPGATCQLRTEPDRLLTFTFVSEGLKTLTGVPAERAEADPGCFTTLIHEDDRAELSEAIDASRRERTELREEFRIDHPDKGERWLELRAEPEDYGDGDVTWTGVLIDVTENQRNLIRLMQQERRFRTLFENAPIGLWEEDWSGAKKKLNELIPEGTTDLNSYLKEHPEDFDAVMDGIEVVLPNQTSVDIVGADSKQQLVEQFRRIITERTRRSVRRELHELWNGGKSHASRSSIRTFDGEERQILRDLQLVHGHEDWSRVFVSYRDITETARQERELQESRRREERFRKLAETIGGVFWQYDPEVDEFLYMSSQCAHVFGVTREQMMTDPSSLFEQVHPEDREFVKTLFKKRRSDGYNETYRVNVDGSWRWIRDRSYPVRQNGELTMITGVAEDITEQVKQQQKLKDQIEETKRMSQLKSDFVARTTHDLRTPLNSIIGIADLMSSTDMTPTQEEYLQTIWSTAHMMLHITNDILDLDRVENGTLKLMEQSFQLRGVLQEVTNLFGPWILDEDLLVTLDVDEEVPERLVGDSNRLKQVLINLIGNAVKFTDDGRVQLSVREASRTGDGLRLHFAVSDTGPGIPEEKQEQIFEDRTGTDTEGYQMQPGAGLGLSVCQTLVRCLGGEIGVRSEIGEGSTFWFTVPFEQQQERTSEPVQTDAPGLDQTRVLVVDDNRLLRRTFEAQLRDAGATVLTAGNAAEAREELLNTNGSHGIDAVFLDRRLGDGLGTRILKEGQNRSGAFDMRRVCVLSGESRKELGEELQNVPHGGILQKPVTDEELRNAVKGIITECGLNSGANMEDSGRVEELDRPLRVVAVEDDPPSQSMLKEYLRPVADELNVVKSGKEAIDAHESVRPHVMLVDMELPDMQGTEVIDAVRDRESQSGTGSRSAIIVQTALPRGRVEEEVMEAGADAFLEKPFDSDELHRSITSVLEQKK